jgi:hypothetical protein
MKELLGTSLAIIMFLLAVITLVVMIYKDYKKANSEKNKVYKYGNTEYTIEQIDVDIKTIERKLAETRRIAVDNEDKIKSNNYLINELQESFITLDEIVVTHDKAIDFLRLEEYKLEEFEQLDDNMRLLKSKDYKGDYIRVSYYIYRLLKNNGYETDYYLYERKYN